jgi:hypothetical protein
LARLVFDSFRSAHRKVTTGKGQCGR